MCQNETVGKHGNTEVQISIVQLELCVNTTNNNN